MAKASGKIVIRRLASLDEVNANRAIVENFFAESRFASYELSWARVENLIKAAFAAPDKMAIFIAEHMGKILGFVMCGISGFIGVVGLKICQVQFLHIIPEHRKSFAGGKAVIGLLKGVQQWAEKQGAVETSLSLEMDHATPAMRRIMARMGYQVENVGFFCEVVK